MTETEDKIALLMKSFQELQLQRKEDAELIRELKGKLETRDEKETQKEELTEELRGISERESALQEELEAIQGKKKELEEELKAAHEGGNNKGQQRYDVRAPEEKIAMTFGGDQNCSASHLRQFIEHYKLIRMVNMRNLLANWDDPSYRAAKLRIALHGAPASYIGEESSMAKDWTENDDEIIKRLKERYIDTESIELRIMEAEEVSQEKNEPLSEYLSRVQRVVRLAYPEEPENIINKRVAWKFLSGIQDKEIRSAVIKEKWMAGQDAKPLEEILLIAETTRKTLIATTMTGQSKGTVSVVKRGSSDEFSLPSTHSSRNASSESTKSSSSSGSSRSSKPGNKTHQECLYCRKKHPGGWKDCFKRKRVEPDWTPAKKRKSSGNVRALSQTPEDENF